MFFYVSVPTKALLDAKQHWRENDRNYTYSYYFRRMKMNNALSRCVPTSTYVTYKSGINERDVKLR